MSNFNIPKGVLKRKKKEDRQKLPSNIFAGNTNSIPEKIIVYFNDSVDIKTIDQTIRFKYQKLKESIPSLEEEMRLLETKKKQLVFISDINDIELKIKKRLELINNIKNNIDITKYNSQTCEILKSDFKEDKNIINEYIEIAKNYISIEVIKKIKSINTCSVCGEDIENLKEDRDGLIFCPSCDCIIQYPSLNKYSKDLDHYNNIFEEDIGNFIKVLDKFEGKNSIQLPPNILDELDEYFLERDMQKGEYYRNKSCLENGKKEGTSKKKLWEALEYLNYNHLYEETTFLTHIYWGWRLPDLTLYRDQILKDYQNTQQIWLKIKNKYKRSASLGTQYRLYVQLKAVGYPHCEIEDFKIQDMVESLRLHNNAWEIMCKEGNVKFYSVMT